MLVGNGPVAKSGAWSLQHRKGGNYGYNDAILEIRQNGQVQARIERGPTDGYVHRAYSFTPDGQTIISGGANGNLTAYDRQGQKLGDFVGHTSDVFAVAVSGDGKLLVSGSDDQTVRLWNVATRELLLTIFRHKNGEWVAWTPQGYYAASPNGDNMIGWQVNRGPEYAPDYYPAGQFKQSRYQPDLLTEVIRLGSEKKALAAWQRQQEMQAVKLARAITKLPTTPKLISGPQNTVTQAQQTVRFAIDSNTERLVITLNGRPLRGVQGVQDRQQISGQQVQQLTLSPGVNQIQAIARNQQGESKPLQWTVTYQPPVTQTATTIDGKKPALYILAIGVSNYADNSLNLGFAHKDAIELAARFQREAKGLYREVYVKVLVNEEATRANVLDALSHLDQMTQNDLALLFIAGHGMKDPKGNYFFLPHDANTKRLLSSNIQWSDFQNQLSGLPGNVLLWADTCHAGGASGNAINVTKLARQFADAETGVLFLGSSTSQEGSAEYVGWGHGAFTKALLDGMNGEADLIRDNVIYLSELKTYVKHQVTKLTRGIQHPVSADPPIRDFAIVRVR